MMTFNKSELTQKRSRQKNYPYPGSAIADLVVAQYRAETYEADVDLSNNHEVADWLSYFTLPIETRSAIVLDDLPLTGIGDVLTVEISGSQLFLLP